MRLTVIGCSGSYPGPDSAASCYLVEAPHDGRIWRILLDLGSGALGTLQRYLDPLDVDAVFISHLHPDHFFDISGYYVLRKYHPAGPQSPIPVWGPEGLGSRSASAYGLPEDPGMSAEFDFHAYDGRAIKLGPFTVTTTEMAHPIDAFGLRVEADGRVLAYSGDTGPCASLVDLARGADLLLAEAAFREGTDNPGNLHLTGREAGAAAVEAGVGRLVLTHIPPWHDKQDALDEAREVFQGRLELAATGATYDI
jgi:ribonuclease BN (tRNA processing enzyme)